MQKAVLVATLLAASASAHAAWVTKVIDAPTHANGISALGIAGHVTGGLFDSNGTPASAAYIFGPGGFQSVAPPSGATYTIPVAINASGYAAGYAGTGNDIFAFIHRNGTTEALALPGYTTAAGFINHAGQVAGHAYSLDQSSTATTQTQGFVYDRGVITPINMGGLGTYVYGINASGQVAGSGTVPGQPDHIHAFLHSDGVTTDLGTLPGSFISSAEAINDAGQVAGYSTFDDGQGTTHAFRYSNGTMTDLGTLGGGYSAAVGINNAGLVIGYSDVTPGGDFHAFVSDGTQMTDLGTLGGSYSYPTAINHAGQIVGSTSLASGKQVPFLYERGVMINVADLVTGLTDIDTPVYLNDAGQIAGTGKINGKSRVFLLTWIPDNGGSTAQATSLSLRTFEQQSTSGNKGKPATAQPQLIYTLPKPNRPGLSCVPPACITPGKKDPHRQ